MHLHGLLLVNKPSGITSHDVVGRTRRALQMRDVGHTGTLDPLASGLMVILLGEGTKLSDYILNGDKAYRVKVRLGVKTDSQDMTGQILSQSNVALDPHFIVKVANELQGKFNWPVPLFSATKVEGKKLYEYAHQRKPLRAAPTDNDEKPLSLPIKEMNFWDVKILEVGGNFLEVQIKCSKGSFIRTWADQLGELLGVGGAVEALTRVMSDPYDMQNAISLEDLERQSEACAGEKNQLFTANSIAAAAFIPLQNTLPGWKTVTVRGKDEKLIYNGQISYDLERRLIAERREATRLVLPVGIKILSAEGELLAIVEAQPLKGLKIRRVFRMLQS